MNNQNKSNARSEQIKNVTTSLKEAN